MQHEVTYITAEDEKITVVAKDGWNLLDIAHTYDIELEGACEGSLACSTCHVIMEQQYYDKLEEPTDEENDMLDLAFGLTETYVQTSP
ncbi:Cytochrome c oxidase assembly protein cox15 [Irineochytrium annulatum]|nr:Cytochrome c oxidase assembly protein cox15 [Irineochytrium annulatum]